jgi:hypothetical protein
MLDYGDPGLYGSPAISFRINITAAVQTGFVEGVNMSFWENHEGSEMLLFMGQTYPGIFADLENLSFAGYFDQRLQSGLKACIEMEGVNRSREAYVSQRAVHWILRSPQNYTHQMRIDVAFAYFNGTVYERIVQPFQFVVEADDNNSFETADSVEASVYSWLYFGGYDSDDYYRINLVQGTTYCIMAEADTSHPKLEQPYFQINIYYPNHTRKVYTQPSYSQNIVFTAEVSGEWFIKANITAAHGFYWLCVGL